MARGIMKALNIIALIVSRGPGIESDLFYATWG
jgi:hypothetical protein